MAKVEREYTAPIKKFKITPPKRVESPFKKFLSLIIVLKIFFNFFIF